MGAEGRATSGGMPETWTSSTHIITGAAKATSCNGRSATPESAKSAKPSQASHSKK